ncbi:MAG: tetratricopeptide repeat protein [Marinilabiliales bacterium]|nr:tetratricopeptide repeat protein [Marinilabiliales bacterium]
MKLPFPYKLLLLLFSLALGFSTMAQEKERSGESSGLMFQRALTLFDEGNFGAAIRLFEQLQTNNSDALGRAAGYFVAAARSEQGNSNGGAELKKFVEEQPESPYAGEAYFRLANLSFRQKKYSEVLQMLDKADPATLLPGEQDQYDYTRAVALLETGNPSQAKDYFNRLRGKKGPLGDGARYYWAHICYSEGKYDEALAELEKLQNTPVYFKFIPYYQMQIAFAKGQYNEVAEQGIPLLARAPEDRKFELARIVVTALYRLERYEEAIGILEKYFPGKEVSRADCYVAGYCYEKGDRPEQAISWYEKSIQQKDAISQGTYYQLGGLYMKKGDKQKGLMAFQHASEMKFDAKIRQDALFQYAKATYELDYSPFNESIRAFDRYIAEYPNAKENDLAYNYLVNVFMTTHNYKDALASLDKIKVKSPSIRKAYQRVTLFRGMELFKDLNFQEALALFDKSLASGGTQPQFKARATFWRGEALNRLGKPDEAAAENRKFQSMAGSNKLAEYPLSVYNLGYYYFNNQQLENATECFNRYIGYGVGENDRLLGDVYNRLGDCNYADREFDAAIQNYQRAIQYHVADEDYSTYQIAFIQGLLQNQSLKIEMLTALADKYPESAFRDDALFETGKAYEKLNDFEKARNSYQQLISAFQDSPLLPKALVQLGLIAYNQNHYDESVAYFKQVVEKYPESQEAKGALTGIKNNYLESNRVEDYVDYTRKLGRGTTPSENEQDSLIYAAAEKSYMSHAPDATGQLTRYLNSFPQGQFVVDAHYYRADCLINGEKPEEALPDYEAVLAAAENPFTESALTKAADLAYESKAYGKALDFFQKMELKAANPAALTEAFIGVMRCQYELGKWEEVVKTGWKIRSKGKLSPELDRESSYKSAKAYEALNDMTKALPLWRKLSSDPKTKEGAEAKYNVCKYYADNNRLKDAENEVMDFIAKNSPHKYWLGKSFILLAHIYEKMNDLFQATNTLKSVIENYETKDDGIVDEASAYLKTLEKK